MGGGARGQERGEVINETKRVKGRLVERERQENLPWPRRLCRGREKVVERWDSPYFFLSVPRGTKQISVIFFFKQHTDTRFPGNSTRKQVYWLLSVQSRTKFLTH